MEQAQRAQQQAQEKVQNAQQGQGFGQFSGFPAPPQGNNQPQSARDYFDQLRNQLNKDN